MFYHWCFMCCPQNVNAACVFPRQCIRNIILSDLCLYKHAVAMVDNWTFPLQLLWQCDHDHYKLFLSVSRPLSADRDVHFQFRLTWSALLLCRCLWRSQLVGQRSAVTLVQCGSVPVSLSPDHAGFVGDSMWEGLLATCRCWWFFCDYCLVSSYCCWSRFYK